MSGNEKRKVRYAVVGLGNIAQVAVLPAFAHAKENSELVALVSSDPEKLHALSSRYAVDNTGSYDDLETVLERGRVDAAYVAVPNSLHRSMVERIAKTGVHVLCEKPMALRSEDAEAMIRTTSENGVKLMIAYRLHFEQANLEAIERIRAGEIGTLQIFSSVFSHRVREGDIRTRDDMGGGALYDMGVYCINAARYLFQAEPEEVMALQFVGTDARFPAVDGITTGCLRFSSNRVAQFTVSQGAADVSEYRVVGSKGDLRLDPAYDYVGKLAAYLTVDGKTKEETYAKRDQFAPELVYFSQCILEGHEPEPSGEEGLADVRILEALVHSARTRQAVPLPPFVRRQRPTLDLQMKKPAVGKVETVRAPSPSK
jgi:predicted dehydrogenase